MKACGCRDCRSGKITTAGYHRPNPENQHDRMVLLLVLTWGMAGFSLKRVQALLSETSVIPDDDLALVVQFFKTRFPSLCREDT